MSTAKPAAAYKNVVKGKLNLKGSKPASSSSASSSAAAASLKRKKEETDEERREREDRELERLLQQKKENESKAAAVSESAAAEAATSAKPPAESKQRAGMSKDESDKQAEIDLIESDQSLTKAERDFQRAQKQRELEMIRKKISKTHRQRIEEYNAYLGSLSEHNDIPRVGPG